MNDVISLRFCPKCKKQAAEYTYNTAGNLVFSKCVICGYTAKDYAEDLQEQKVKDPQGRKVKILTLLLVILLSGCIVTPPMITDVYRDGDDLVFHKATIQVNTVTYQVNEKDGRDVRVSIR